MSESIEQRAVAMIEESTGPLASAIARQIKRTVPRYSEEDFTAIHLNIKGLLSGVPALVRGESLEELTATVREIARERSSGGFTTADFTVASLCILPVLRHFFIGEGGEQGLKMYDAVEAVILPFMGRSIAIFADAPPPESTPEESIVRQILSRLTDPDSDGIAPIAIEKI